MIYSEKLFEKLHGIKKPQPFHIDLIDGNANNIIIQVYADEIKWFNDKQLAEIVEYLNTLGQIITSHGISAGWYCSRNPYVGI